MMAEKVLGLITRSVRKLEKSEGVYVFLPNGGKTSLSVIESGDCRLLPISRKVAEVLIANGMAYGD